MIENISAITLATHDMARAVPFYRMLGFEVLELSGWNELSQSDRPAGRANVVLVGTCHLLPFRRRRAACEGDRGRLSSGHGAARCRMGRALLPSDRPGRSRAQLRQAAAVRASAVIRERCHPRRVLRPS